MVRGMLTDSDREWLQGNKDYNHETTDSDKIKDVRGRVYETLRDFELLAEELPAKDREKIFRRLSNESDSHGADVGASVVEFLYKGYSDIATDPEPVAESEDYDLVGRILAFRRAITTGIERGKANYPNSNENAPEKLIIASNAYLFQFPDPDEVRSVVGSQTDRGENIDKWKEVHKNSPWESPWGNDGEIASQDDVSVWLQMEARKQIHREISTRQHGVEKDLIDYEKFQMESED